MAVTKVLTPYQVERYGRHIIMSQVGSAGQRKLLDSRVLVVGAGGLGSPVAIYLTLAGVGTIGLVDFDTVDLSNLQRQILHQDADIGRSKVESATETLKAYNPEVNVVAHEEPLTSENAMGILSEYDVIVNGNEATISYVVKNNLNYLLGELQGFCLANGYDYSHVQLLGVLNYLNISSLYGKFENGKYGDFLFLLGKYMLSKLLEKNNE